MKKTFLLLTAILLMSGSIFAQKFDFSIGPKFGYQTANLSYKKADIDAGFKNHFTLGAFGRMEIGRIYLQPEVLWFKDGNAFTLDAQNVSQGIIPQEHVTVTWNAMNLQVPILVGIKVFDINIVALRAQVGPTANFMIGGKPIYDETFTITPQEGGEPITIHEGDQAFDPKTIAWGLQAGLGCDVIGKITLDINYNFGLSKVFKPLNDTGLGQYFNFDNIDNTKQSMFMVTVGYKFL